MASFRAESHTITTSSSNPNPGEPAGTANGDFLLSLAFVDVTSTTLTSPSGWTDLYSGSVTSGFRFLVSRISRGGSAVSTTWTKSAGTFYYEVYILTIKQDTGGTLSLDSQSSSGATGSGAHDPDPPATTAVATSTLAVTGMVFWGGSITAWTAPTNYTLRTNNAAGNDGAMATRALSASGTENPGVFTGRNGTSQYWDGFTLTIVETAATQDTPELYGRPCGVSGQRQMQQLLAQRDVVRSSLPGRKWVRTEYGLDIPEPFKLLTA